RGGPRTDYYADVRYRPRGGELRLVKRVETDSPDFRQGFNYDILYFPERPDDIVFKARVEKQFPYFVVAAIMSLTAFVMGVIWWLGVRPQRVDTTWDKPPTPIEGRPEFWEPPSR
ncbi:MAG TPA: hypothetical protein PKD86_05825, partial [Gemmatales bacterium]|nr:hypothetical protein [Gemmatales bacterium]